jgi:hypothetical protein
VIDLKRQLEEKDEKIVWLERELKVFSAKKSLFEDLENLRTSVTENSRKFNSDSQTELSMKEMS